MKYIFILLVLTISIFAAENKNKTMNCLFKEVDAKKVLDDKGLNTKEHIENLLYGEEHKEKYFLKALVLDYYYNSLKAEEFYEHAYQKADFNEKGLIGLYYALYLQKIDKQFESTRLMRGMDIYMGKGFDMPKRIAYQYEVYGLKIEPDMASYFKLKGIVSAEVKGDVNECRK